MPGALRSIDRAAGVLSRFLHFRRVKDSTTDDIAPYLGVEPSVLLPAPTLVNRIDRRTLRRQLRGGRVVEALQWRSEHVPLSVRYGQRHVGEYARNETVTARWTYPRSGPRSSALVYVHGWLEPGPWVEENVLLPRLYRALGVDVLHVQLPFHGRRNPESALFHGEFFWTGDLVRSFEAMRQSCIDVRTLVAWLRTQGYAEVGVTGISMGGSIAMVLACLEPAPAYIVPIVGHLQLADAIEQAPIFWRMRTDLERFGVDRARRLRIFEQLGLERLKPIVPRERQLWIMARDDLFVSAAVVERQWRAWGSPPIEWLPAGHMTFPLWLGRIVRKMREFHASLAL